MRYFHDISLGWCAGDISSLFEEAKSVAQLNDCKVNFEFNGVKVNLTKHSEMYTVVPQVLLAVRQGKTSVHG